MNRKGTTATLSVGLLATALVMSGCGSSQPEPDPAASGGAKPFAGEVLTVMQQQPGATAVGSTADNINAYNQEIADAFHDATGATLELEYYTSPATEITRIQTSVVSGDGPDVMNLGLTLVAAAYATGAFHELSDDEWAKLGGQDLFEASHMLPQCGPSKDKLIGVPAYEVPFAVVYNTKLFEEAGIDEFPTTWDDYVDVAQQLTDPAQGVYGTAIDPADPYNPWKDMWTFNHQLGSTFLSEDNETAQLNTESMADSVEFWFDWYEEFGIVDPNSLTWNGSNALDAFAAGKVGMLPIQSVSSVPAIRAGAVGDDFAFASPPSVPYGMDELPPGGNPAASMTSGQVNVIASYSNVPLALEYLKIVSSKEMQIKQWEVLNVLPTREDAFEEVAASSELARTWEGVELVPNPFVASFPAVQTAVGAVVKAVAAEIAATGGVDRAFIEAKLEEANQTAQLALDGQG